MCDFVNPNIMGSLATFRRTFETPISRSRDTSADTKTKMLGEARAQELTERTKSFVLRRSSALLLQYLPEKVEQVLFLPLMPMQAEIYRAMLRGKQVRAVLARGSGGPNDALCKMTHAHIYGASVQLPCVLTVCPFAASFSCIFSSPMHQQSQEARQSSRSRVR